MNKWIVILVLIIPMLVLSSSLITFGQESNSNFVYIKFGLKKDYTTTGDSVENVPLIWHSFWLMWMGNTSDVTHEPVVNPRVTLESSLDLRSFYPDDPEFFAAQPEEGLYIWDFAGYNIAESEELGIAAHETNGTIVEKPRFTVSRIVSPEVLADKTTVQKVTVFFRLEEPLPDEAKSVYMSIMGKPSLFYEEEPLVEVHIVDQSKVGGWKSGYDPYCAWWATDVSSPPEIGKTYIFEATVKSTRSNKILGSPRFKPRVYISYGYEKNQGTETSNSVTITYSDVISVTLCTDNILTWTKAIFISDYGVILQQIILGIVEEKPPFHVRIDADVTITPETLDLASEGTFTTYTRLPEGYDANDIDMNTISCNGASAVKGTVFEENNTAYRAEFNIQSLVGVPIGDAVTLTITGELTDRTRFEGSTKVKVVNTQLVELAEKRFEEAVAAFDNEDYESAEQLFSQAQDTYRAISNSTKVSECQDYVDQCSQYLEEKQLKADKAVGLFDEGIAYFEQEQYSQARTKFEEALTLFTELDDEESIKECEEWIASCEEALNPPKTEICLGTAMIGILYLLSYLVKWNQAKR